MADFSLVCSLESPWTVTSVVSAVAGAALNAAYLETICAQIFHSLRPSSPPGVVCGDTSQQLTALSLEFFTEVEESSQISFDKSV